MFVNFIDYAHETALHLYSVDMYYTKRIRNLAAALQSTNTLIHKVLRPEAKEIIGWRAQANNS